MPSLPRNRIESIDLLKGLVMVIMALDHVRDYFHFSSYFFDPTDPTQTNLPLFFTRFVTHFCAPTFSFLAGLSAFMIGKRKSLHDLSVFLFKRGLWLVFIELTVINFAWHFDTGFRDVVFQVIWILGVSMIFLSLLVRLPQKYILIFSCLLIFGHNLLDPVHVQGSMLWSFVHERKIFDFVPGHTFAVGYTIIPWVAVMSLGYCFGPLYDRSFEPLKRKKILNGLGLAALAVFLLLRGTNIYGNPVPWKDYGNFSQNLMSFLNLNKYPPSLLFLLVTLGVSLIFLANSEQAKGRVVNFFCVFGRVPFFYYIIHLYLIHLLAMLAAELTGFGWQKMVLPMLPFRVQSLKGFGFNLGIVYLVWILVIAVLYPVCKAFDQYKQQHKDKWWLSYL